jgi:hypothetical protein
LFKTKGSSEPENQIDAHVAHLSHKKYISPIYLFQGPGAHIIHMHGINLCQGIDITMFIDGFGKVEGDTA